MLISILILIVLVYEYTVGILQLDYTHTHIFGQYSWLWLVLQGSLRQQVAPVDCNKPHHKRVPRVAHFFQTREHSMYNLQIGIKIKDVKYAFYKHSKSHKLIVHLINFMV